MKKKVIFSTSGAGSVGKTMISGLFVDQARNRLGISMEAYLCDLKETHDALYKRYGQRDSKGKLIPLNVQKALNGVQPLDLFMQASGSQTDTSEIESQRKELAQKFAQALESDADTILFDMPATHFADIYTKVFASIDEFANALDFSDRDIYIIMPFADEKSLSSISAIYKDTKDIANIKYVVALNKGKFDTANGIDAESYYNSNVYKELAKQQDKYRELVLPTLKSETINALDEHHVSHFNDYNTATVIKEHVKPLKGAMLVNQDLINLLKGVKHNNANGETINAKLLDDITNILGE